LAQIEESCAHHATGLSLELTFRQSNHEGELVDLIQSARQTADAIIINPAGYSFTSIAILDAIKAFEGPVIEVHISNIHARDEYHRHSKIRRSRPALFADWDLTVTSQRCTRSPRWRKNPDRSRLERDDFSSNRHRALIGLLLVIALAC
jgi:hypothetical protein